METRCDGADLIVALGVHHVGIYLLLDDVLCPFPLVSGAKVAVDVVHTFRCIGSVEYESQSQIWPMSCCFVALIFAVGGVR